MPPRLKAHYRQELEDYNSELAKRNFQAAWRKLERAHILGQAWPKEHKYVHWVMMKFGFRMKNAKGILGQLPRLLIGGVKSFVGEIPVGNMGGANVPPLRPMEIPNDLAEILNPTEIKNDKHRF